MDIEHTVQADAIIFDKDGTLLDFDAFWIPVTAVAIKGVLKQLHQDESLLDEILDACKMHNGITEITSVVCYGTYEDLAEVICAVLQRHGCTVEPDIMTELVANTFNKNVNVGKLEPTCPNLREVLIALKNQGKKLAVVTSDNKKGALFCLEKLGIADLFDKIYADDGKLPAKPCPDCAADFCAYAHVSRDHMLMVGDTLTDIEFAKNAGIQVVGVAKTEENEEILHHETEMVVHDVSDLLTVLS